MLKFSGKHWSETIADITSRSEYQTAVVRLEDPDLLIPVGEYDIESGEQEFTGDPVVYEGQARIIGVRWGVGSGGESQANAKSVKAIRVQFPPQAVERVRKGFALYVTECDRNPVLTEYVFLATNDFQGSSAATRTVEFALDSDVEAG